MSACIDQALLQVTPRLPREHHEIPRIAINQSVCFERINRTIFSILVVLSRHQKLKLLYAANR